MAKKKNKEESLVPKDEKALKMEGVQNLYNFLFEACNILRGPVSQDNFKDYITPILYFKRISDVYDEETQTALEESGGDEEYASLPEQHRFIIPDGCHWSDIRERSENLGAAIVGAMRGIELANPDTLYGVLSMFSAQKWTDKKNLSDGKIRDLIEHLSTRRLGNNDYPTDLMGDAYEILLKKFADDSKAQAGEFYTPRSVVSLLVRILDPKPGETVYDPACGSGGMLIEAVQHMNHSSLCCGSIFGQEKNVVNSAIDLPPQSRNEQLAQMMFTLGICERRGSGIDRAIAAVEGMFLPPVKFTKSEQHTRVFLYPQKSLKDMTKQEKISACYQHACLMYEDGERINNQSVRERFELSKNDSSIASRIISDTLEAGLIKPADIETASKKYMTYIPYYG